RFLLFSSIGLRWGFHPQAPDKGFHPLTLLRFAAVSRLLNELSIPKANKKEREQMLAFSFCSVNPV
ncbi:MAG: hypothetical protein IJB85_08775, partial [Clostridia bacterium]|nr:hypothetical protein [Clostridia bacterium]